MLVELGVVEQRYRAVLEVLEEGLPVTEVARRHKVARQTVHEWLTLKFYAQFTRPADQAAAVVIPSQLDGLRKKERLRELYYHHRLSASGGDGLTALAAIIGPQAGLEEDTALAWLTEFAAAD